MFPYIVDNKSLLCPNIRENQNQKFHIIFYYLLFSDVKKIIEAIYNTRPLKPFTEMLIMFKRTDYVHGFNKLKSVPKNRFKVQFFQDEVLITVKTKN